MGDKRAHHTMHSLCLALQACILEAAENICKYVNVESYSIIMKRYKRQANRNVFSIETTVALQLNGADC